MGQITIFNEKLAAFSSLTVHYCAVLITEGTIFFPKSIKLRSY